MTIEQEDLVVATRLRAIDLEGDAELGHKRADEILAALLVSVGYVKTVAAYRRMKKWYS
jgi:hypothetical protein